MTMTTHVRFLDPVDPRLVWEQAKRIVNAPEPFEVDHISAGQPSFEGAGWINENAELRAHPGQGADALIWLEYGPEGSLLNDSEYEKDRPPAAFVEVCFDQPYSLASYAEHDGFARQLFWCPGYTGRLMQYRGEDHQNWREVVI